MVTISPLSDENGGGFLATVPDLPGCMSDGEAPEDALPQHPRRHQRWMEVGHERRMCAPEQDKKTPAVRHSLFRSSGPDQQAHQ